MGSPALIRKLPEIADVDVLVAMSPENFTYVGQTHIITVKLLPPRQAFAVLSRKGEPFALVCSIEESLAREESWIKDIRTYTEFKDHPIDALVQHLKSIGFTRGRLGIDMTFIPQASYARLIELLPGIDVVDTTEVVAEMRAIKDDKEVDAIENATKITQDAVLAAMTESKLGDTEQQMAFRIARNYLESGADGSLFMCFGSGKRSSIAHPHPTERVPKESEIIRLDVGGTFGPWASDFARTYSTGNPTKGQKQVYNSLWKVQDETIRFIRPGVTAEEVFYTCKAAYEKYGLKFHMPHIGHSFGIELHENPMLRPGDKSVLKKGMVFNVEPVVFDDERSGYHLEDLVLVTETVGRLLTHGQAPQEIPTIGVPLK
jgi:Xaa-Pro aminopeptidase